MIAPLTLFAKDSPGRCMDLTPSGYYYLNQSSTKFVIFFDGGGECRLARQRGASGSQGWPHAPDHEGGSDEN
jgi:hypothetical protein